MHVKPGMHFSEEANMAYAVLHKGKIYGYGEDRMTAIINAVPRLKAAQVPAGAVRIYGTTKALAAALASVAAVPSKGPLPVRPYLTPAHRLAMFGEEAGLTN
jgi:hypothetical protein